MSEDSKEILSQYFAMVAVERLENHEAATDNCIEHVLNEASRRCEHRPYFSDGDLRSFLDECVAKGYLDKIEGRYQITEEGQRFKRCRQVMLQDDQDMPDPYELESILDDSIDSCQHPTETAQYIGSVKKITENKVIAELFCPETKETEDVDIPLDKFTRLPTPDTEFEYNKETGSVNLLDSLHDDF